MLQNPSNMTLQETIDHQWEQITSQVQTGHSITTRTHERETTVITRVVHIHAPKPEPKRQGALVLFPRPSMREIGRRSPQGVFLIPCGN